MDIVSVVVLVAILMIFPVYLFGGKPIGRAIREARERQIAKTRVYAVIGRAKQQIDDLTILLDDLEFTLAVLPEGQDARKVRVEELLAQAKQIIESHSRARASYENEQDRTRRQYELAEKEYRAIEEKAKKAVASINQELPTLSLPERAESPNK